MKLFDLLRLIRHHIALLLLVPLLMAGLVIFITRNPDFNYTSETTLFTGIASGSSVEMDKTFNYFMTNTAFDNLINVIKSRATQQEVGIRLLSQHLLLDAPDPKYLSVHSYTALQKITPKYVKDLVIKELSDADAAQTRDSLEEDHKPVEYMSDTNAEYTLADEIPPHVTREAYEKTVENLMILMASSDTNFVYKLLNYPNKHYSYRDISTVKVQRIFSSDLVQLQYTTDDPGICQQTLAIITDVCIRNYRFLKENRSDAVVRYFEEQLRLASLKLQAAEDRLLQFNKENNIINYYEQSKAVAVVKEDIEVEYNKQRIKLAGLKAAIARLEEKLEVQEQIQLKSASIVEKKNKLGELNYSIALAETSGKHENPETGSLEQLKKEAETLKNAIRNEVTLLYSYGNTKEGIPLSTLLNEWINHVIEAENVKAGMDVMDERIREFQKQYAIYAPAGALMKRIEREIAVSEQEYLEILHDLDQAKLKMQDLELSSQIKVVDLPYYPISPIPTKRKILVAVAALFGFLLLLTLILFAEYLDRTLRNAHRAKGILPIPIMGMLPKVLRRIKQNDMKMLTDRIIELAVQQLEQYALNKPRGQSGLTVLVSSTLNREGKTIVAGNLAHILQKKGRQVLMVCPEEDPAVSIPDRRPKDMSLNRIIRRFFFYPDERVDPDHPFLADPETYLGQNAIRYYSAASVLDGTIDLHSLVQSYTDPGNKPDFTFIEIPSLLENGYMASMISHVDLLLVVCRANRIWTEADNLVVQTLIRICGDKSGFCMLNGVDYRETEDLLGIRFVSRNPVNRFVRYLISFQFLTGKHF